LTWLNVEGATVDQRLAIAANPLPRGNRPKLRDRPYSKVRNRKHPAMERVMDALA
jgi:hypothetical protein